MKIYFIKIIFDQKILFYKILKIFIFLRSKNIFYKNIIYKNIYIDKNIKT